MPRVLLREAVAHDLTELSLLETELFPGDPWSRGMIRAEIESPSATFVVAVLDEPDGPQRIVGYGAVLAPQNMAEAEVHNIAVVPECRRDGLGARILDHLMRLARRAGASEVFLEVRSDNTPAISLYRSREFDEVGVRRGYYPPDGQDALIMRAPITRFPTQPVVLGIESSCDETGVGIVRGSELLANVIASSMEEHARFGGVVPEIAARAHLEAFRPTLDEALAVASVGLDELDAIAVTAGPGLAGALMVGIGAAKGLALATGLPLYGVNHLVGHVGADLLTGELELPTIALLVSGGHTSLLHVRSLTGDADLLGETIDDAAGEAFDKVARILGLSYPGGPSIDRAAETGDPAAIRFPRGLTAPKDQAKHRFDFSFSGLKTAVARHVERAEDAGEPVPVADVAASFREAVVDVLLRKALDACAETGVPRLLLGGGVVANARLREEAAKRCADAGVALRIPPLSLCTDNGAMIAALGAQLIEAHREPSRLDFGADSTLPVTDVVVP